MDENIPGRVADWLRLQRPAWTVNHTSDAGLNGKSDQIVFEWAQVHQSVVITFDDDFADQRSFPVGEHCGIVRLRTWPTTIEETQSALKRLLDNVQDDEIAGALIIISRTRIRIRHKRR